ncbi:MAG TPA: SLC13 family permease, partial [Chromatiaceae bacterium]|nr:SLC13 family permease [Chromatiaceae bacterium]
MTATLLTVFFLVYLGMILGGLPFLQLDRTGVALLGAIALVGTGVVSPEGAVAALHLPTLMLLFAFMVLSAQLRLGGFYAWVTRRLAAWPLRPALLLGALVGVVGALSAVFSNDVVCLAVAPVLIAACHRRRQHHQVGEPDGAAAPGMRALRAQPFAHHRAAEGVRHAGE